MEQQQRGIIRRAGVGVARAWAYSLGLTGLLHEGQRIAGNVGAVGAHVRRKLSDGPENYRHETFKAAVLRLGLQEVDLVRQAKAFHIRAISWLVALMLATCWMAYIPWSGAPLQHFLLCLGVVFLTFSKSFTWRFRYCQIRDQDLSYDFWPWLFNPGRW